MEVKDENQPHILEIETCVMEINVGVGGDRHSQAKFPAKDEICHNCKVKDHFSAPTIHGLLSFHIPS